MRARVVVALVGSLSGLLLAACASDTAGLGTGAGPRNPSGSATGTTPGGSSSAPLPTTAPPTSAPPSSSGAASTGTPLRTLTVVTDTGHTYVIKIWAEREVTDCAEHAYGSVVAFLHKHQCFGLRQVLATTRIGNRAVGFAERTIGFRGSAGDPYGYRAAGMFRSLVSRSGTGNLNDLMREGDRLPAGPHSVPFPNAFSALGQDNGVTVLEAWYLAGSTPDNDATLETMAQDIFLRV